MAAIKAQKVWSSILSAKFDCPVARQNFHFLLRLRMIVKLAYSTRKKMFVTKKFVYFLQWYCRRTVSESVLSSGNTVLSQDIGGTCTGQIVVNQLVVSWLLVNPFTSSNIQKMKHFWQYTAAVRTVLLHFHTPLHKMSVLVRSFSTFTYTCALSSDSISSLVISVGRRNFFVYKLLLLLF